MEQRVTAGKARGAGSIGTAGEVDRWLVPGHGERVLVTGGRGMLGRVLVPQLLDAGYSVRITSRRAGTAMASEVARAGQLPSGTGAPSPLSTEGSPGIPIGPSAPGTAHTSRELEVARLDLISGAGLAEALHGVHTVVHAASSPFRQMREADVFGTRRLLEQAREAGVRHVIYISIVGIDRAPISNFSYYQIKLAAEREMESSGVPWTVLRATQFHDFIEMVFLKQFERLPFGLLPLDFRLQSVDVPTVAHHLVRHVASGPAGRAPDLGGPQVLTLAQMARVWLQVRGLRRLVMPLCVPPFVFAAGFRKGQTTLQGGIVDGATWDAWVHRTYGATSGHLQTSGKAAAGDASQKAQVPETARVA